MAPFIVNHPTLLNNWVMAERRFKKKRNKKVKKKTVILLSVLKIIKILIVGILIVIISKLKLKTIKRYKKIYYFIDNDFDFEDEYPFNKYL